VKKLQETYGKLQEDKDSKIADIKKSGLGLMSSVLASAKAAKKEQSSESGALSKYHAAADLLNVDVTKFLQDRRIKALLCKRPIGKIALYAPPCSEHGKRFPPMFLQGNKSICVTSQQWSAI